MGDECPEIVYQLWFDLQLAEADAKDEQEPTWKRPGERATQARDRLRAEREVAKRRHNLRIV